MNITSLSGRQYRMSPASDVTRARSDDQRKPCCPKRSWGQQGFLRDATQGCNISFCYILLHPALPFILRDVIFFLLHSFCCHGDTRHSPVTMQILNRPTREKKNVQWMKRVRFTIARSHGNVSRLPWKCAPFIGCHGNLSRAIGQNIALLFWRYFVRKM